MNDRPASRGTRRSLGDAFTLIEMLLVVTIIAFMAGMIVYLPKGTQRDNAVRAAAEELAGTFRLARSYAISQRAVFGVAFNIENAPGTSGRVLNNFSGGHWYQIVGPGWTAQNNTATYPYPSLWGWDGSTMASYLIDVQSAWIGDRHVLPRNQVRFLALGDQDDGTMVDTTQNAGWGQYPATYPRPWFGYWDATKKRLYPWGGYDSTLVDAIGRSCSGFYYQGNDGAITGCTNPATRATTYAGTNTTIFQAGGGRPLINAAWLDYMIIFYPDGTAKAASPFIGRIQSNYRESARGGAGGTTPGDLGDLTPLAGASSPNSGYAWNLQITNYYKHTGCWSVTLCPDAVTDSDSFNSASLALASIWPAYRVTVNQFGVVSIVRVTSLVPNGTVFDTTITNYQSAPSTNQYYQQHVSTTATGALRAHPVTGFLNESILSSRNWWYK